MQTAEELKFAPLQKIERAASHIKCLRNVIDSHASEASAKIVVHFKPRAGYIEIRPESNKAIPPEIPLILGDAIHNLASALDVCLYGMAKDRAPSPENIMFPFPRRPMLLKEPSTADR